MSIDIAATVQMAADSPPDESEAHRALVAFSLDIEGRIYDPDGLDPASQASAAEALRHLARTRQTPTWLSVPAPHHGWLSPRPVDPSAFVPARQHESFRQLAWKPRGGIWTSPCLNDHQTVWSHYLELRGELQADQRVTPVHVSAHDARVLCVAGRADLDTWRAGDLTVCWEAVQKQYDVVTFTWSAAIEGICLALTGDPTGLTGLSVPSALWFRPWHQEAW